MNRRRFLTVAALATGVPAVIPVRAQESATKVGLSLGKAATVPVPADYLGFSCELSQLADPTFFDPDNRELVSLFKALTPEGILRLGGNSSEFCWWKAGAGDEAPELPESARRDDNWMPHAFTAIEPASVDRLNGFLEATGWTAIYGLNLGTGTPEQDAEEAAYVARRLGKRLLYFQIGNEPEFYRDDNNRLRPPDWDFRLLRRAPRGGVGPGARRDRAGHCPRPGPSRGPRRPRADALLARLGLRGGGEGIDAGPRPAAGSRPGPLLVRVSPLRPRSSRRVGEVDGHGAGAGSPLALRPDVRWIEPALPRPGPAGGLGPGEGARDGRRLPHDAVGPGSRLRHDRAEGGSRPFSRGRSRFPGDRRSTWPCSPGATGWPIERPTPMC
jgi:hypothetical protein